MPETTVPRPAVRRTAFGPKDRVAGRAMGGTVAWQPDSVEKVL